MAARKIRSESVWRILERHLREAEQSSAPGRTVYAGRRLKFQDLEKAAAHYGTRNPDPDGGSLVVKNPGNRDDWDPTIEIARFPDRFVEDPSRAVSDAVSSKKGVDVRAGHARTMAATRKAGGFRAPPSPHAVNKGDPIRAKSHVGDHDYTPDAGKVDKLTAQNPRTGKPEPIKHTMHVVQPALPYGMTHSKDPDKGPQVATTIKGDEEYPIDLYRGASRAEKLYDVVLIGMIESAGMVRPVSMVWMPSIFGAAGAGAVDPTDAKYAGAIDDQEMELLDMIAGVKTKPMNARQLGPLQQPGRGKEPELKRPSGNYLPPARKQAAMKVPTRAVKRWDVDSADELFPGLPDSKRFGKGPKKDD